MPDGDLFRSIRRGGVDVVTDHIDTFTPSGIRLASGGELEADVVVTATGLSLLAFGGIALDVDGVDVSLPDTMAYKGMLLSGVPNFAYVVGYTNASWTLKADLVGEYVCRLLSHLDAHGLRSAVPVPDASIGEQPFMDFAAGYVLRSIDQLPRQGTEGPWRLNMSYADDTATLRRDPVDDGVMRFSRLARPGHGLSTTALQARPSLACAS